VRVSDYVLKSVGFVGEVQSRNENGVQGDLHATGFFVSVPSSFRGTYLYFVTARHVAEDLRNRDVYVLVNEQGGGTTEILAIEPPMWFLHPTDATCDVAVVQMNYLEGADILPIPISELLTPEAIAEFDIGIGDEVFATGLFSEIPNTTRNLPILRHGNIAMMPTEQLQTDLGFADVHLIEARSIGGLSGSPVFVRPTAGIALPGGSHKTIEGLIALTDRVKLLGLMHGHWDVKESEINNPKLHHDRKRGVNYGIAIATPAIKIIETINRPELKGIRMRQDEAAKKRNVPGMDSARQKDSNGEQEPFTQEQFEIALKKASRKIESDKS
jgi:hypothetical protein